MRFALTAKITTTTNKNHEKIKKLNQNVNRNVCTENIRMRLKVFVLDIQKRNSDVFFILKNMLKFSVVPRLDLINFIMENCLTQRERECIKFVYIGMNGNSLMRLYLFKFNEYSFILMHFPFQCDFCFRRKKNSP